MVFLTTFIVILLGFSWGSLPHRYLQAIIYIQKIFAKYHYTDSSKRGVPWSDSEPTIQRNPSICVLARSQSAVSASDMRFQFDINKENALSIFDVVTDFASSGLQSIVQVCISFCEGIYQSFILFLKEDLSKLNPITWGRAKNWEIYIIT